MQHCMLLVGGWVCRGCTGVSATPLPAHTSVWSSRIAPAPVLRNLPRAQGAVQGVADSMHDGMAAIAPFATA